MPAPSPATNPSRSLSNGRDAFSGASLRSLSARAAVNPEMPSSVMVASAPPVITMSASPCWMCRIDSPMAWLPVAHAETGA